MKENSKNIFKKICVVSLAAAMLMGGGLTEMGTYIGTAVQVSAVTSSSKETPASSFEYEENENGGITITKFIGDETNVVIPSKIDGKAVTSIGDWAFSDCTSLTEVTIPNSVTSIGKDAFSCCESLTEITIPDSVTSIGDYAFTLCKNLKEINVDKNNKNYSSINGVIFNKDKTTLLKYPLGKTDDKYSIPNGVTSIGISAFGHCKSLTEITIPDSVTVIGIEAFALCTNLTEVTIPDSVTDIGDMAFARTGLTEVTIPNSVTYIGTGAFNLCESLTKVTIGNNVTDIEDVAFSRTGLTDVYYTGSKEEWKKIHIERNNSDLTDATIHYNCSIDDTSVYASNVNSALSDNNDGSISEDFFGFGLNSSGNNNNSTNSTNNNSSVTVIIVAGIGIIAVTAVIIAVKLKNKKQ